MNLVRIANSRRILTWEVPRSRTGEVGPSRTGEPRGDCGIGQTTLSDDAVRGLLICLGILGLAVAGAVVRIRDDGKALRHKLFRPNQGVEKSSRPGRVAERLGSFGWEEAFGATLARACRDFENPGTSADAAFESVALAED